MDQEKLNNLHTYMEQHTRKDCIIAFSGGVDSSLMLKIACEHARDNKTKVYAYTIHTMLHPMKELELTEKLAREMGAIHRVVKVDEIGEAGIENNPVNRCYLCKKCMFSKVMAEAERMGITTVIEGTNADDRKAYRPGIQALKELGVQSPLLLCGITKAEIRELAREYGIAVSDRPSVPCLATRFAYGTHLEQAEMQKVEAMESMIRDMGFYNVRTRIQDKMVRIEVDDKDMEALLTHRKEVITEIKKLGYDYVTVDLEGFRSGSQDIHIVK